MTTYGHKWSTLFREKALRLSMSTTSHPRKAASIAIRNPQGPAPTTNTCKTEIEQYLCECVDEVSNSQLRVTFQ